MSDWTPGPWEWRNNFLWGNGEMLMLYTVNDDGIHCENDADARLIAAAPELADALRGLLAIEPRDIGHVDTVRAYRAARAVLAKLEAERMSDVIEAMARAIAARQNARREDDIGVMPENFEEVRAALRAAEAAGWRLVPSESTREMRAAWALQSTAFRGTGIAYEHAREVWSAMLAAAPSLTGGDDAAHKS